MKIHEPRVDEWARFRDLRLRALREDPAAFGARLDDEETLAEADWRGRILQPGTARFVVEEEDGRWIATAGVGLHEDAPPEVFGMWVAPEARGRGLGRALVDEVARWASAQGADRLALWVNVAQAPAVRMYERAGFAREGEPMRGHRDPSRIFQRMVRALGPSDR